MTKVLVINTSLRKKSGNTAMLLEPFIEGMKAKGADIEVVYTEKLDLKQCRGCLACWFKTPGICSTLKEDDMRDLLDKMSRADYWILASPIYSGGVCVNMQLLLERTTPLLEPTILSQSDPSSPRRHPRRPTSGEAKIVFLSTAAWTREQFEPSLLHLKTYACMQDREFIGAILRPTVALFRRAVKRGVMDVGDIIGACKEAGEQLITDGRFSTETVKVIGRDLVSIEKFDEVYNQQILKAMNR
ncbi:MAG: hypothetical protein COB67_01005 [SAR324 cluster bacterium]|uniref:NADPH-dependent FMN reductase-like domain-containing protein n=1 Tax=SAR324 cluster bacterium TaxID=2024889 RepID=A0A2A4TAW7_9DELT|nr:MAG: hypothetical protein COB67_01005 [SAR324 cluster bacterium]